MTYLLIIIVVLTSGEIYVKPTLHMDTIETCRMAAGPALQIMQEKLEGVPIEKIGFSCRPVPPWYSPANLGPEA